MSEQVTAKGLTAKEKTALFWASFLSLVAAGVGFAFRIAKGGEYGSEFALTYQQVGQIMGASFWPIAVTMILFSLVVDKTGYKYPMYVAFVLQAASGVLAFTASSYDGLYYAAVCAGLGHGIVEAVINPICAAVYPKDKTKRLTILHAAWPAGVAGGSLLIMGADAVAEISWKIHALWIVLPAVAYALMYRSCRFPVDERVQAGVSYRQMLQQVGFLGASLAAVLLVYELGNSLGFASGNWLKISLITGGVIGLVFGLAVRSVGKPLFFLLCCLMLPVATAELATDGWIQELMRPALGGMGINVGFAIVFSATIMLILRVFAGSILQFFSPPALLALSGLLSAIGLYWLSAAAGVAVLIAFLLYAVGQTYYWPCILGFTSERYPEGGALTLNTVSAIGLLFFGIIGAPILGVAFDQSIHSSLAEKEAQFSEIATTQGNFLGSSHDAIDKAVLIFESVKNEKDELVPYDANNNGMPDREEHLASLDDKGQAAIENAWSWMDGLSPEEDARVRKSYGTEAGEAGRAVLKFAARFPAILVIAFGLIFLYFRSRGGYKPVELRAEPHDRVEEG